MDLSLFRIVIKGNKSAQVPVFFGLWTLDSGLGVPTQDLDLGLTIFLHNKNHAITQYYLVLFCFLFRFVEIGVASFGSKPNCATSPGGFARLTYDVLQWIRTVKVSALTVTKQCPAIDCLLLKPMIS